MTTISNLPFSQLLFSGTMLRTFFSAMDHIIAHVFPIIESISFLLGMMGIIIICIGSGKSAVEYVKNGNDSFQKIRLLFGQHLIIGLDFFVGKDIIDTMLIKTGTGFWEELAGLVIVVIIRIALTLIAEREIRDIAESEKMA